MSIPSVELSNGLLMPLIGLGVYRINDVNIMRKSVRAALDAGIRLFDTATAYENEDVLGEALKLEGTARESLFLTSKVSRSDVRAGKTTSAFYRTLRSLNCDYLDLYLIHWPVRGYEAAWEEMTRLFEKGLIKAIGVSNFLPYHFDVLQSLGGIVPMVAQMEFHPYTQQPQTYAYCRENGISFEAYGPFKQGELLQDKALQSLAEKYNCNVAQLILAWIRQRDVITIFKSSSPNRIADNVRSLEILLSNEDVESINNMNINKGSHPGPFTFW